VYGGRQADAKKTRITRMPARRSRETTKIGLKETFKIGWDGDGSTLGLLAKRKAGKKGVNG